MMRIVCRLPGFASWKGERWVGGDGGGKEVHTGVTSND